MRGTTGGKSRPKACPLDLITNAAQSPLLLDQGSYFNNAHQVLLKNILRMSHNIVAIQSMFRKQKNRKIKGDSGG